MAIRFRVGGGSANGATGKGDFLAVGLMLTAFGLLLAWIAAHDGLDDLLVIALVMAGSGVWIGGLHRLLRGHAPGLAILGGLFSGWALVGAVAAALNGYWFLTLPCAVLLFVGLLVLGVVPLPGWAQRARAAIRRIGLGLLFMAAGLAIIATGLGGAASEGVPPFVPVVAGAVFLLGGTLAAIHESGSGDSLLARTLVALLVTGLATCSIVLPPRLLALSLLATAPFTVLAWIAVARLVIERLTGRDPLATWSDQRVLGLGCVVTVAIGVLILGLVRLRSCVQEPRDRPPAEAVDSGS